MSRWCHFVLFSFWLRNQFCIFLRLVAVDVERGGWRWFCVRNWGYLDFRFILILILITEDAERGRWSYRFWGRSDNRDPLDFWVTFVSVLVTVDAERGRGSCWFWGRSYNRDSLDFWVTFVCVLVTVDAERGRGSCRFWGRSDNRDPLNLRFAFVFIFVCFYRPKTKIFLTTFCLEELLKNGTNGLRTHIINFQTILFGLFLKFVRKGKSWETLSNEQNISYGKKNPQTFPTFAASGKTPL